MFFTKSLMLSVHFMINGIAIEQDLALITSLSCYRRLDEQCDFLQMNSMSDSVVVSSVSAESCHTSPFTLGIPFYLIQCLPSLPSRFPRPSDFLLGLS